MTGLIGWGGIGLEVLPSGFHWSLHGAYVINNVNRLEKRIGGNLLDFSAFFQTLFLQVVLCSVRIFKRMRLHDKGVQCPDSSPHCENHYKKKSGISLLDAKKRAKYGQRRGYGYHSEFANLLYMRRTLLNHFPTFEIGFLGYKQIMSPIA